MEDYLILALYTGIPAFVVIVLCGTFAQGRHRETHFGIDKGLVDYFFGTVSVIAGLILLLSLSVFAFWLIQLFWPFTKILLLLVVLPPLIYYTALVIYAYIASTFFN